VSDPPAPPERLLCDTSFAGASAKRPARSAAFTRWPTETVRRIDAGILAISVITLAEARYGYRNADWEPARIEREERRLAGFLQIPLDPSVVDEGRVFACRASRTAGTSATTTCGSPRPRARAGIPW